MDTIRFKEIKERVAEIRDYYEELIDNEEIASEMGVVMEMVEDLQMIAEELIEKISHGHK